MDWIVFATGGASAPSQMPLMFVILATFGIFYFILIRPQQKKQKAMKKMVEGGKTGVEVSATKQRIDADNFKRRAIANVIKDEQIRKAAAQNVLYFFHL